MDNIIVKTFEESQVEIILENGEPLFELYSTGMALGQVKIAKGRYYPRKDRIDENLKSAGIEPILRGVKKYITLNDLFRWTSVINCKYKLLFIKWLHNNNFIENVPILQYTRKEEKFIDLLEKILEPFHLTLYRQYLVCQNKYRIDLYIRELNVAIEYDEDGHKYYSHKSELKRENEIKYELNCTFIRLNDNFTDEYNVGLVLYNIIQIINKKQNMEKVS